MIISIFLIALIGFSIAAYTYRLEQKIKINPSYKPVCDLSDMVSCTKPMKSKYASLFYFSNAALAMGFYALIALAALLDAKLVLMLFSCVGFIGSCIYAYILYYKLRTFCLLCTTMYLLNILLLYISFKL